MADLRNLHDHLLILLTVLEALTTRPNVESAVLSGVRYRLSRVSGKRRKLIENMCVELAVAAQGERREQLLALRAGIVAARAISNSHIGRWSLQAIEADWAGYCRASAEMRGLMRAQIAHEKAVLYPLLAEMRPPAA